MTAPPATLEPKLGDLKSLDDCISFLADAVGLASWSLQRDYDQSCLVHLERLKVLERVAANVLLDEPHEVHDISPARVSRRAWKELQDAVGSKP